MKFCILGDNLGYHNGAKFSTKEQDNDTWKGNCAVQYQGGWWFGACVGCNLNGPYQPSAVDTWHSVAWPKFGNKLRNLKKASMMIRSKN